MNSKILIRILPGILLYVSLCSCSKNETNHPISMDTFIENKLAELPGDSIKKLTRSRIYFGHQSVGFNILHGITLLQQQYDLDTFNIVESKDPASITDSAFFVHNRIGRNGDPKEKIDAFVAFVDTALHGQVDIAFLKFCYSDIFRDTDTEDVFNYYVSKIAALQEKYPRIRFLHVTVPLRKNKSGFRSIVSGLIGRNHNIKREQFNDLIRDYYPDKQVFDLAACEYLYPDGRVEKNLSGVKSIISEYTTDGGHLTDLGSKVTAAELLKKLTKQSD